MEIGPTLPFLGIYFTKLHICLNGQITKFKLLSMWMAYSHHGHVSKADRNNWVMTTSGKGGDDLLLCPGFGWDRVNFLVSSWYRAVFWILCENNVDNTLIY